MMRYSTWMMIFGLFGVLQAHAQYPVTDINPTLKKGADMVVRLSDKSFNVYDNDEAVYSFKAVYSVLNEDAAYWGVFYVPYGKFSKVKNIKIVYYDASGKTVKKVRSGEIKDINTTSAGSVYDDSRVKYYEPSDLEFPFTVSVEYELSLKSTLNFYPFIAQLADRVAIESSQYEATVPKGYKLRYKEMNGIAPAQVIDQSGEVSYRWLVQNEKAIQEESQGASARSRSKSVLLAPSDFSVAGYKGDMSTWKGLGTWQWRLNQGRDELPVSVKEEVKQLVADARTSKEKVRRIYDYLQNNTRYVSIQLGIGGWQPFPATNVVENGYGDCKALSNYTMSLLKAVGIRSNYVIINAGAEEDDIVTDFPSNQFNHVILSVPMESDTLWLECTSQTAPFNFLGDFTSGRHGLMITEGGGVLVKTPDYSAADNSQIRKAVVTFDQEGNANADVKTIFKGVQYGNHYFRSEKGKENQRKYLLNVIDIPVFDLGTFDYEEEKTEEPKLTETFDLSMRKYASATGKRLFFVPNLLNRRNGVPPKNTDRASAIVRRFNYMDIDTLVYKLPENYRLEFEPEPVVIDSEFGKYNLNYDYNPETNELTYVRYIKVYKGKYPANTYADFRNFWRKIARSDKSKLVLIGTT